MIYYIFAIIISILFSAFFSGTEIAYTALNKLRLNRICEEKNGRTAKLARKNSEQFDNALSAILIGNNLANIYSSSIATVIAINIGSKFDFTDATSGIISTVVMTIIILIFGEIVPKVLCKQHTLAVSLAAAWPLRVIMYIFWPITFVVLKIVNLVSRWFKGGDSTSLVTEDELSAIIDTVEEEGVIDEEQSDLLQSALSFPEFTAEEILTPRIQMLAIDIDDDLSEITSIVVNSSYSRLPVYRGSIDHIIGVLFLNRFCKELVDNPAPDIQSMLIEPYFVHKTIKLPSLLAEMRKRQTHMAVVLDEYGGTMGIVTMEDILEQIVGDIWDETDEITDEFVEIADHTYEVYGALAISDLLENLDIDDRDFESDYSTVGGWAVEMLNSDPHIGDTFTFKNLDVTITQMSDNCVSKIKVFVHEVGDEDETD